MTERVVDHSDDVARMAEIERYRLLDSDPRPELVALADLAARVCGVPSAFISVITDTELRQLGSVGFEGFSVPRAESMCDAVLLGGEPLVSADLRRDPRFRDNPYVRSGNAVFYASFQLISPSGVPFGSLCVFDDQQHEIDDSQRQALRDLADRIVDVLELEVRNRQLASSVDELERSNQQLAAFAGQVSHDLRNPLGAVHGTLELLDDLLHQPEPDLDTARELVVRAHRSTSRMTRLVREVLEFAALGGKLDYETVRVEGLVDHVRADLEPELSGVSVSVGPLDDVFADPVQLRIVLQNVLQNAAKYSRAPAPSADPDAHQARIEVATEVTGSTWTLRVVDHGPGVAPADRETMFEPFVRGETGTDGTGMGLATSSRIIEAHQGSISLDATPGGGATVTIKLPLEPRR